MPGFDPNHLAHRQPDVVRELPGFDSNYQITAPGVILDLQDVGLVGRCPPGREQWRSRAPSAAGVRRMISLKLSYKSSMHVLEEGKEVYVVNVEAAPSRSEAG
eukprot:387143-Pleurochrysis_carterae.AAC.1